MKTHLLSLIALLLLGTSAIGQSTSESPRSSQRLALVEEFTSSTCGPCASMNAWLNPLLETNAEKCVVVKYQMNWPTPGDPYYTAEGGVRRDYYNINSVPTPLVDGVKLTSQSAIQNAINNGYALPAEADIVGTFIVSETNITINASVTPTISGDGYTIHTIVCEKMTTENKKTNGEKEFHHVMMKMLPNGSGTTTTLTAGTAIPLNFTYDMSTTHVEEMSDLEVVVFVQKISEKNILNSAYLEDITPHPENVTAGQTTPGGLDITITWEPPTTEKALQGYNIYRDDVKLNSLLITDTHYNDVVSQYGKTYCYSVAAVIDGIEGYRIKDCVTTMVDVLPVQNISVSQVAPNDLNMTISWEAPNVSYPITGYNVYRNNIKVTPTPITTTTFESKGLSFREYCFVIETVVNELSEKSEAECITLEKVPIPENFVALQVSTTSYDVKLLWEPVTAADPIEGYNIYRNDVKINTDLVTEIPYIDVVPNYNVSYCYKIKTIYKGVESDPSVEKCLTLTDQIPAPQNASAKQVGTTLEVTLSWTIPTMEIDGYYIYRGSEKITSELVTDLTYTDAVPAYGEYCYFVVAVLDDAEGLHSNDACVNITNVSIGENNLDAAVRIFPNPVSDILNIQSNIKIENIQIFDVQGRLIYSNNAFVSELSTKDWASGIYILHITTENGIINKRIVKK